MTPARSTTAADAARFLVAGALNTALTTVVYFVGLLIASPGVSYTVAWLVGLVFVMAFYPHRVFVGGDRSLRARLMLAAIVIAVYLIGIVLLRLLIALTGDPRLAFVVTLAATTVVNFILGRTALRRGGRP